MGFHLSSRIGRFVASAFMERLTAWLVVVALLVGMVPPVALTPSLASCLHRGNLRQYLRRN